MEIAQKLSYSRTLVKEVGDVKRCGSVAEAGSRTLVGEVGDVERRGSLAEAGSRTLVGEVGDVERGGSIAEAGVLTAHPSSISLFLGSTLSVLLPVEFALI
ncbi:hypothetical protein CJ030_MR1G001681 [Morella rubra]|uniref:Uncharacterized protein n=1 Tax=Morella rubra TaxID=262757 RepID=A0A6A1WVX1_9ROSI|nr:hypothetical protein CJ030_MR1G001681 [Morella rubra]